MSQKPLAWQCACPCGSSHITVTGKPVMRFLCHCTTCQRLYRTAFADIVILRSGQISRPLAAELEFSKFRLPPAVNRGLCRICQQPVVGFFSVLPFLGVAFVPAANFPAHAELPTPALHAFYDRRQAALADPLPKYRGYWRSQWALLVHFIARALLPRSA